MLRRIVRLEITKKILEFVPDRIFLKLKYRGITGKTLDLRNPITYNEKLQWLKLNDRKHEYTIYVDKFSVREYIEKRIGKEYLIPLIAVYNSVDEIEWDKLPEKFVLKCTHGSGCNIVCTNKKELDIEKVKKDLANWMNRNWFWYGREWPYKNVKPRIICEQFLEGEAGKSPEDYKFFCFDGIPKLIQVDLDRFGEHKQNFYDSNWNFMDISIHCENDKSSKIQKPYNFDKMIEIVKELSRNIPHVRVDLYNLNGEIFFGELTFYHLSGFAKFKTDGLEKKWEIGYN